MSDLSAIASAMSDGLPSRPRVQATPPAVSAPAPKSDVPEVRITFEPVLGVETAPKAEPPKSEKPKNTPPALPQASGDQPKLKVFPPPAEVVVTVPREQRQAPQTTQPRTLWKLQDAAGNWWQNYDREQLIRDVRKRNDLLRNIQAAPGFQGQVIRPEAQAPPQSYYMAQPAFGGAFAGGFGGCPPTG